MNLGDLRAQFRADTGDTAIPYFWSDDAVDGYLNEAVAEAAIRARLIRDDEEIAVTSGSQSVALPAALFDIQYAELRDAAGDAYEIRGTSRQALDADKPGWRSLTERPEHYVHDDKTLLLDAIPDADYTLYIEFFRTPSEPMTAEGDAPEIHEIHHEGLLQWAFHRAYSVPDADTFNPGKAKEAEDSFIRMFGRRPNADLRRRQNANRPHRNRVHL